jgi:membrane-bound lytic murein transglycosylase B
MQYSKTICMTLLSALCTLMIQPVFSAKTTNQTCRHTLDTKIHSLIQTTYPHQHLNIATILKQAHINPKVLELIHKPYEKKPWYQYKTIFITPKRITQGAQFFKQHQAMLAQAEKKYHVAPSIITAIIGIESNYGHIHPKFNARDTLFTLACLYQRRALFFQQELAALMTLKAQQHLDLNQINGSYAGALGMPQFMPSSYLHYAQDGDHNNHINLFTNHADVIFSIANYLHQFGWQRHQPVIRQLQQKPNQHIAYDNQRKKNVSGAIGLQITTNQTAYYQPYPNFNALLKYNQSPNYAMSVYLLAKALYKESKTL